MKGRKYRGRNDIYEKLLEACEPELGCNKMKFIFNAEISYEQLNSYLGDAMERELIRVNQKRYHLTDKGRGMLDKLRGISEIMK